MLTVNVIHSRPYRGAKIFVRLIGVEVIEYLVVWKGNLYAGHFDARAAMKKAKREDVGAAGFLILNVAEGLVDSLVKKHSLYYRFIGKHYLPPVEEEIREKTKELNGENNIKSEARQG